MEERKYKDGDKVRLRDNLIPNDDYDGCSISPRDYSYFKGCNCVINIVIPDTNRYDLLIERDEKLIYGVEVTDLMIEPLERIPEETKIDMIDLEVLRVQIYNWVSNVNVADDIWGKVNKELSKAREEGIEEVYKRFCEWEVLRDLSKEQKWMFDDLLSEINKLKDNK